MKGEHSGTNITDRIISTLLTITMLFNYVAFPVAAEEDDIPTSYSQELCDALKAKGLKYNATEGVWETADPNYWESTDRVIYNNHLADADSPNNLTEADGKNPYAGSYYFDIYWKEKSGPIRYKYDWNAYHSATDMSREIKLVLEFGRTPNDGEWVVDRTNEATSLDGTTTYDSNPDLWFKVDANYYWKRVCTEMQVYTKTRALSDRKYSIELKKSNVDALGGEDAVYVRVGSQYIKIKNNPAVSIVNIHGEDVYQIDVTEQNKAWYEWLTSNARNAETENSYNYANNSDFSVYLGVKKEVINSLSKQDKTDGKDTIKVYAHAERKYNDEDEWLDADIPDNERGDENPNWSDKHRADASYKFEKPHVSGEVGTQKDIIGYREYIPDTVRNCAKIN